MPYYVGKLRKEGDKAFLDKLKMVNGGATPPGHKRLYSNESYRHAKAIQESDKWVVVEDLEKKSKPKRKDEDLMSWAKALKASDLGTAAERKSAIIKLAKLISAG